MLLLGTLPRLLVIGALYSVAVIGAQTNSKMVNTSTAANPAVVQTELQQALSYYQGSNGVKSYPLAFALFQGATQRGSKQAEAWLGNMYMRGQGVPQNIDHARAYIQDSALSQDPVGLRLLGLLYQDGVGVPQDYVKARTYYEQALAKGDIASYGRLGLIYLLGLGTPQDRARATDLLKQGAAGGDPWAQSTLGHVYEKNLQLTRGVIAPTTSQPNYPLALQYYEQASSSGNNAADYRLGQMYASGAGVKQDYVEALTHFKQAAVRGYIPAQFALARLCELGQGTGVDYVDAYIFYTLAARKDNPSADQHAKIISRLMTSDQRQQATIVLSAIHQRRMAQLAAGN